MESGIAFIGDCPEDPFEIFKEWFKDAQVGGHLQPDVLNFTTCSQDGQPSSRNLLLRRLDDDGIVIVTDKRSKKCAELDLNPKAAVTFLWIFMKDECKVSKQVRMEGVVKKLNPEDYKDIYDREPLYCKLRSHVCHQGQPVAWETEKEVHDKLYEEAKQGKNSLAMPDWFVGYKFYPNMFDFYLAFGNHIADRLCYLNEPGEQWRHFRIAA